MPINICTLIVRPIRANVNVSILDDKGRTYYERKANGKNLKVNFPRSGAYRFVNCYPVNCLPLQMNEAKFSLFAPERKRVVKMPDIVKNENFNGPARINTKDARIELGPPFFALPIPTKIFILLHEIGHFYYKTESKCDAFAYYHFCKLGYNNSQAFYALSKVITLHNENLKRLFTLLKLIQQNEK